jgi:cell division septal protein FtsQ
MDKKKSFFYFPTWTLILICILFMGATVFEIFLILNLDSFETITVNGVEHSKGSQEYLAGLKTMKQTFGASAILTLLLSVAVGWFGYKRIKAK